MMMQTMIIAMAALPCMVGRVCNWVGVISCVRQGGLGNM